MKSKWTVAPITSRILTRAFGRRDLRHYAEEHQQIAPPEKQKYTYPSVYIPGQLDKIKQGVDFSGGLSYELELTAAQTRSHGATVAYLVRDLYLTRGVLCNFRNFEYMSHQRPPFKVGKIEFEMESAAMCSTPSGNEYFAHFIFDNALTAAFASEFSKPVFASIGEERTEQMQTHLNLVCNDYLDIKSAYFKELWLFDDVSLNTHKIKRLKKMRSGLRLLTDKPGAQRCYIVRGKTGTQRVMQNEDYIIEVLQKRGFCIIRPEVLSTREIHQRISDCELVVGIEGSNLIHGIMALKKGGGLLCIQPPLRFNAVYRTLTGALELNWGFVVGEETEGGFSVNVDDLLATIDLFY